MSGRSAPTDRPRRDAIEVAVAAYDEANPLTPLPRNAARLLTVMFPRGDVCHRSLEDLTAEGFSQARLPGTLRRLVRAGFLTWEKGWPPTYWLHLPPLVRR
jgi:hypothetical protein